LHPDRRPALRSVLHSLLVTYSSLLASLLAPPPISEDTPPEWRRHVEWITILSQNLMAAANDLRPVQACFLVFCQCHDLIFVRRVEI
jgi:mediator of RNA polymerase II transcription subunit 7